MAKIKDKLNKVKDIKELLGAVDILKQELEEIEDIESLENIEKEIEEVKKIKAILKNDFEKIEESISEVKESLTIEDSSLRLDLEGINDELNSILEDLDERNEEVDEILSKIEKSQTKDTEMYKLGLTNLGEQLKQSSEALVSDFNIKYKEIKLLLNKHKEDNTISLLEKDEIIDGKFLQLEKDLKKFAQGIYQYGSSFSISVNGIYIGTTAGVNFKAGTNVTLSQSTDSQGNITITFNATSSGSGISFETPTGVIGGTSFIVLHTPKYIVSDGVTYFENNGYTLSGLNITMDIAPQGFIISAY